jgi:hypothetical protein
MGESIKQDAQAIQELLRITTSYSQKVKKITQIPEKISGLPMSL